MQKELSGKETKNKIIYIATNEKNETSLKLLRAAGFKLASDLKLGSRNSLDTFIIELQVHVK